MKLRSKLIIMFVIAATTVSAAIFQGCGKDDEPTLVTVDGGTS